MKEDKREQGKPQPGYAPEQVWLLEDGCTQVVINWITSHGVLMTNRGPYGKPALTSCIGISTPAGRVMVGERRREPRPNGGGYVHTVLGILDGNDIRIHEGIDPWRQSAERVASWPLLPPTPAQGAEPREKTGIRPAADLTSIALTEQPAPRKSGPVTRADLADLDSLALAWDRELGTEPRTTERVNAHRREMGLPPIDPPPVTPRFPMAVLSLPAPPAYPERRDPETCRVMAAVAAGEQAWSRWAGRQVGLP